MHTSPAMQMTALGLLILAAHLGGRICRRLRLSEVTGQLIGGALVGPYLLELEGVLGPNSAYAQALEAFHFFVFVFLGLVAFGIGEELHFSRLRKVGRSALIICVVHVGLTWGLMSAGFFLIPRLGLLSTPPLPLWAALLIGAIGVASAPAVAFVLMNQLRIEGRLRHVLGSVMVLTDLFGILLFSLLMQVGRRAGSGDLGDLKSLILPMVVETGCAVLLGLGIFIILRILVRRKAAVSDHESPLAQAPETDFLHRILAEHPSPSAEILLVILGTVSLGCGAAYLHHWPFLITAIVAGFMAANFHSHALFASLKIDNITPVMNLGFFALIGAKISLKSLTEDGVWLAAIYIVLRLVGKLVGVSVGCRLTGEERKISACLPRLLLPQAGVAAVEAVYVSEALGKPEIGAIVLPAIVVFEVTGVFLVDRGLRRWRSWVADEERAIQEAPKRTGPAEAAERLLQHLTPARVQLACEGADKTQVIARLVDRAIANSDQHIDRDQALQVLAERERLAPTGFGHGIAMPHCRLMGLDRPVLVMARHAAGVEFGGVDTLPCHLILLLPTPARDPSEHLRLISAAAHVLGKDAIRERLRAAESPEAFLGVLRELVGGSA